MGMDVYGKNPKQNKPMSDFPVYYKYRQMEEQDTAENESIDGFKQKWKELDADHRLREQYYKESSEYERANVGHYFRNNCWWWRPLWNYCYHIADDIISEEVFENGHSNSGEGLDDKGAKLLGNRLLQQIREGKTIEYQAEYQQYLDDLPDNDFDKHYPFDIDNVKEFAEFCIESGGFEIN